MVIKARSPIGDSFTQNPFVQQHLATPETAHLEIRGHEDVVQERLSTMAEVAQTVEFDPEAAQHTIVFGEWGHGKTHLLNKMNATLSEPALSHRVLSLQIFPLGGGPDALLQAIGFVAGLHGIHKVDALVEALVAKAGGRHVFLLIDEAQMIQGSGLNDGETDQYFKLLQTMLLRTRERLINLHFVHCFSMTLSEQVRRLAAMPIIREMSRYRIDLNSLDEEQQRLLLTDRMSLRRVNSIEADELRKLILPGVNRLVNYLTGGTPRHVLDLAAEIYERADRLKRPALDEVAAYEALKEFRRHDKPDLPFIDEERLDQLLKRMENGNTTEKSMARFIGDFRAALVGSMEPIENVELAAYSLTLGKARREVPTLNNISVLESDDDGSLYLSSAMRAELGLVRQNSIKDRDLKALQWDLILRPEDRLPRIREGLTRILKTQSKSVLETLRGRQDGLDAVVLEWTTEQSGRIRLLLALYKGDEVPKTMLEQIAQRIHDDQCDLAVLVAETERAVSDTTGSYADVLAAQKSNPQRTQLKMRLLIRNGSNSLSNHFSEQFFVALHRIGELKNPAEVYEYKELYEPLLEELGLDELVEEALRDSIYLPSREERSILDFMYANRERTYLKKDIREGVQASDAHLERLCSGRYLTYQGRSYRPPANLMDVPLFQVVIAELREGPKKLDSLQSSLRKKRIVRRGDDDTSAWDWVLDRLKREGMVRQEDERFTFIDVERQRKDLCKKIEKEATSFSKALAELKVVALNETDYADEVVKVETMGKRGKQADISPADQEELVEEIRVKTRALEDRRLERLEELRERVETLRPQMDAALASLAWPYAQYVDPLSGPRTKLNESWEAFERSHVTQPDSRRATESHIELGKLLQMVTDLYAPPRPGEVVLIDGTPDPRAKARLVALVAHRARVKGTVELRRS